jgi:hypothetical protein
MRAELLARAGWFVPAAAPIAPTVARLCGIPLRLRSPHGVALTFDDGPHPEGTPAGLEVLAHAEARATFFLVGEHVARYPSLAADATSRGAQRVGERDRDELQLVCKSPLTPVVVPQHARPMIPDPQAGLI